MRRRRKARDASARRHRPRSAWRSAAHCAFAPGETLAMAFSEFRGNLPILTALRGALRSGRVPHALVFTGPHGVVKFTLSRVLAKAANCEGLNGDSSGEDDPRQGVEALGVPDDLIDAG